MTATQLRTRIDNRISLLSPDKLVLLEMYLNVLVMSGDNKLSNLTEHLKESKKNKKVWYNGRYLNEATVKLLSGHRSEDTDEERDNKIWEYIKEKYK
ncbi:MAG: hypothetical protein J6Z01_11460 [Bacteroidales bacterium]|nr:hypothetical protein [Bacteroidales bacterium]